MGANTGTASSQLSQNNANQAAAQAAQNSTLGQINSSLSPYLSGNQGFTPAQMAALNSTALDQNAQQYNSAGNQLRQQLQARGDNGATPLSGTGVAGIAGLLSGKASSLSNSLQTNVLNNAQQGLTNQFNANSILSGNAQTQAGNVNTYGAGANSALNAYTSAQANSPLNTFLKTLGGGLGTAGAIAGAGGLGTALSGLGGTSAAKAAGNTTGVAGGGYLF
jgi:hypothetical protein